jgi:hypothetical protein
MTPPEPEPEGESEFMTFERAKLRLPRGGAWPEYQRALDLFEHQMIVRQKGDEHEIGAIGGLYSILRINEAQVPLSACPGFHNGMFSGYAVIRNSPDFRVRLSNGKYVKAE